MFLCFVCFNLKITTACRVTSCAGMTAHFVLLAQTKVGFLSGGRSRHMKELSENEVLAQLEEAYARATVALTRAQKLCIIMGPLDMRGLPGAATVIGCLKYGAGVCGVHVSNQAAEVFLKDGSLNDGPDDEAFLQSLRRSLKTARGAYPPVVLAEIYQEFKSPLTFFFLLHSRASDQALSVMEVKTARRIRDYKTLAKQKTKTQQSNKHPKPKTQHKTKRTRQVFGMKRVKRPKRPNALICRTPGGSIRYPLSCSLGMTLISRIPASPSRFAI